VRWIPNTTKKIKIGKSGKEEGPTWESHLFGGTGSGEGQSRFLMRLHSKKMVVRGWKKRTDLNYLAFSMEGNKKQKPRGYLKPEHIFFNLLFDASFEREGRPTLATNGCRDLASGACRRVGISFPSRLRLGGLEFLAGGQAFP